MKDVFEELNKELLDKVEEYSEEAIEYMKLFTIACGLLDLYRPLPDGNY